MRERHTRSLGALLAMKQAVVHTTLCVLLLLAGVAPLATSVEAAATTCTITSELLLGAGSDIVDVGRGCASVVMKDVTVDASTIIINVTEMSLLVAEDSSGTAGVVNISGCTLSNDAELIITGANRRNSSGDASTTGRNGSNSIAVVVSANTVVNATVALLDIDLAGYDAEASVSLIGNSFVSQHGRSLHELRAVRNRTVLFERLGPYKWVRPVISSLHVAGDVSIAGPQASFLLKDTVAETIDPTTPSEKHPHGRYVAAVALGNAIRGGPESGIRVVDGASWTEDGLLLEATTSLDMAACRLALFGDLHVARGSRFVSTGMKCAVAGRIAVGWYFAEGEAVHVMNDSSLVIEDQRANISQCSARHCATVTLKVPGQWIVTASSVVRVHDIACRGSRSKDLNAVRIIADTADVQFLDGSALVISKLLLYAHDRIAALGIADVVWDSATVLFARNSILRIVDTAFDVNPVLATQSITYFSHVVIKIQSARVLVTNASAISIERVAGALPKHKVVRLSAAAVTITGRAQNTRITFDYGSSLLVSNFTAPAVFLPGSARAVTIETNGARSGIYMRRHSTIIVQSLTRPLESYGQTAILSIIAEGGAEVVMDDHATLEVRDVHLDYSYSTYGWSVIIFEMGWAGAFLASNHSRLVVRDVSVATINQGFVQLSPILLLGRTGVYRPLDETVSFVVANASIGFDKRVKPLFTIELPAQTNWRGSPLLARLRCVTIQGTELDASTTLVDLGLNSTNDTSRVATALAPYIPCSAPGAGHDRPLLCNATTDCPTTEANDSSDQLSAEPCPDSRSLSPSNDSSTGDTPTTAGAEGGWANRGSPGTCSCRCRARSSCPLSVHLFLDWSGSTADNGFISVAGGYGGRTPAVHLNPITCLVEATLQGQHVSYAAAAGGQTPSRSVSLTATPSIAAALPTASLSRSLTEQQNVTTPPPLPTRDEPTATRSVSLPHHQEPPPPTSGPEVVTSSHTVPASTDPVDGPQARTRSQTTLASSTIPPTNDPDDVVVATVEVTSQVPSSVAATGSVLGGLLMPTTAAKPLANARALQLVDYCRVTLEQQLAQKEGEWPSDFAVLAARWEATDDPAIVARAVGAAVSTALCLAAFSGATAVLAFSAAGSVQERQGDNSSSDDTRNGSRGKRRTLAMLCGTGTIVAAAYLAPSAIEAAVFVLATGLRSTAAAGVASVAAIIIVIAAGAPPLGIPIHGFFGGLGVGGTSWPGRYLAALQPVAVEGLRDEGSRWMRCHIAIDIVCAMAIGLVSGASRGGISVQGSCLWASIVMVVASVILVAFFAFARPYASRLETFVTAFQASCLLLLNVLVFCHLASAGGIVGTGTLSSIGTAIEASAIAAPGLLALAEVQSCVRDSNNSGGPGGNADTAGKPAMSTAADVGNVNGSSPLDVASSPPAAAAVGGRRVTSSGASGSHDVVPAQAGNGGDRDRAAAGKRQKRRGSSGGGVGGGGHEALGQPLLAVVPSVERQSPARNPLVRSTRS